MIILNGTKSEHLDMLEGGIIQRLLEEKWKTFARVSMVCVYVCVCEQDGEMNTTPHPYPATTLSILPILAFRTSS